MIFCRLNVRLFASSSQSTSHTRLDTTRVFSILRFRARRAFTYRSRRCLARASTRVHVCASNRLHKKSTFGEL